MENSWADQWANDSNPVPDKGRKNSDGGSGGVGGAAAKYGKKVGEGLGKTKVVASKGLQKVKAGSSVGFQWVKDKYNKTTHKN